MEFSLAPRIRRQRKAERGKWKGTRSSLARFSFLFSLSYFLFATALAAQSPGKPSEAAEKYLRSEFRDNSPGAAVLIARGERVIFRGNYGLAVTKTKTPITSDTVFDIGSISKSFTAAAILLLAEEGKLQLSDPLTRHLPEISRFKQTITLHHLLTHTSGLPHFEPEEDRTRRQWPPEEIVRWHSRQSKLQFAPGERYDYCNGGYVLLSVVVEKITGKPFAEFVRERIFAPLGMQRTSLRLASAQISNRATGYRVADDSAFLIISDSDGLNVQGDGGIQSTVEDLLRYALSWRTASLLKPETIRLALTPATLNDGKRIAYGYGWGLSRLDGHVMVSHDGRARGFRAYLAMFPGEQEMLTVVVLANQRHTETGTIALKLARMFLGSEAPK